MESKHVVFLFSGADRYGEITEQIFRLKSIFPEKDKYLVTIVSNPIDQMPRVNRAHYNMLMRGLNLIYIPSVFFKDLLRHFSTNFSSPFFLYDNDNIYPFSKGNLKSLYYQKGLHKKFSRIYALSELELDTGQQIRQKFGIPQKVPIVTLHVRESGYLKSLSYHDYRNANIENYIPAIDYLIKKGFYIVRIGDRAMTRINNAPKQLIDIHFHKEYSTLADTYFILQSTFMIAGTSGPDRVAFQYGIPILNVNHIIHDQEDGYDNNLKLVTYKKYYSKQLKRNLTLEEILLSPAFHYISNDYFNDSGIELIENTADEVLAATKEMLSRLTGEYPEVKINEVNKRVKEIYNRANLYYSKKPYINKYVTPFAKLISMPFCHQNSVLFITKPQISVEFLNLNPDLLGHNYPEFSVSNNFNRIISSELSISNSIKEGELLFSNGKIEEAEKCFASVLKMESSNKIAYNNLGVISFHKKDYQQALDFCIKSLSIDPYYKEAICNFFKIVNTTKQYTLIIPYLRIFIANNPDDKEVLQMFEDIMTTVEQVSPIPWINIHNTNIKSKSLISQLNLYIKMFNKNGYRVNKPHRNLILTGIPGSGFRYFTKVFNYINNFIYLDGLVHNINSFPDVFFQLREKLLCHKNVSGQINISLSRDLNFSTQLSPDLKKKIDEDVVIGLYQNLAFYELNKLAGIRTDEKLMLFENFGYRVIAFVRDPISSIIYWNRLESSSLPEANITDDKLSPRWKGIQFDSYDKYDRQAQIWQFYADEYLKLRKIKGKEPYFNELRQIIKVYTYEQLESDIEWVLNDCCDFLSIPYIKIKPPALQKDDCDKHQDISKIKASVSKYCFAKFELGYNDIKTRDKSPGFWNEKSDISSRLINYQDFLKS